MTDEQIKLLATSVATETVRALDARPDHCDFCGNEERRILHRQDHEFVKSLIRVADKLENAKWGIGTAVLKAVLIAAIMGGIVWAWKTGVKGP